MKPTLRFTGNRFLVYETDIRAAKTGRLSTLVIFLTRQTSSRLNFYWLKAMVLARTFCDALTTKWEA